VKAPVLNVVVKWISILSMVEIVSSLLSTDWLSWLRFYGFLHSSSANAGIV